MPDKKPPAPSAPAPPSPTPTKPPGSYAANPLTASDPVLVGRQATQPDAYGVRPHVAQPACPACGGVDVNETHESHNTDAGAAGGVAVRAFECKNLQCKHTWSQPTH